MRVCVQDAFLLHFARFNLSPPYERTPSIMSNSTHPLQGRQDANGICCKRHADDERRDDMHVDAETN